MEFFVTQWRLIVRLVGVIKVNNASNSNEKLYRTFKLIVIAEIPRV